MNNTGKIAIGLGIVSSALVATWLFTGDRKKKTRDYFVRKADGLKRAIQKKTSSFDDSEAHYI
jgi:hypothetical protein